MLVQELIEANQLLLTMEEEEEDRIESLRAS